ncbi:MULTISPECIES: outer membrane protein assembly factor BamB family protein [unclassified Isoptericola]|uniref:outer membrane protein assembly factor BamB family protein n=1 Tax=unclassified Isoptericola TaxID=2623355 RepID=UPI00365D699A
MARRRGAGSDAFTFDLEPDGDEEDEVAAEVRTTQPSGGAEGPILIDLDPADDVDLAELPPEDAGGLTLGQAADRVRGFLRGRRLVAAVAVAAVALTAVVVDTVGDRGRLAALRAAPGGVLDLTDEPREVWRVPTEGSAPGGLVGALGGLVVAQQGAALLGLDVETGDRRWDVDLPDGSTTCGPGMQVWSGDFQPSPAERIVCVSARPPATVGDRDGSSTVTVVDADGSVAGSREVGFASTMAFPGPDGGLVTTEWVGDAAPVDPQVAAEVASGAAGAGAIPDGYDLRVRLEDAVTGKVRWEKTLPFDAAVDPAMCVRWAEDGTTSGVDLRGGVQTSITDRVLWLGGCGVDAWFTPDGVRLDRPGDRATFEGFSVEPLVSGGYVAGTDADAVGRGGGDPDRLLRADGGEERTLRGRYLVPLSTDGGGDDVVLERRRDATVATDADGDELWRTDLRVSSLLVRTAQVAVVVDEGRRVYGLDLGTGEVLWSRPDLVEGVDALGAYGPRFVEAAFTDGRQAAFVIPDYARGDVVHWVALDAATGRQLWQLRLGGDGWGVQLAVAGRLVRWSPTEIVGLG